MTAVDVKESVELTAEEREIFDTLLAAAHAAGKGTVLRAAGGWVRDKLLGRASADIDIALDNVLGKDFAGQVNEYLESQGRDAHRAAVIQSNPEQSKHLETARMKVNGVELDLVNLRSETYAEGSRIPVMEFGTPLQDSMRRDFTINSMFYNLNNGCVEDLTGRGMDDLRAGLIRTPLPASETFQDDPLRVLRAVRFATRFGFELEAGILEAASSPELEVALGTKVSRERVGTELEGMFKGPAPAAACQLLHRLSLFPEVFTPPPGAAERLGRGFGAACVACISAGEAMLANHSGVAELNKDERRLFLLAALLLPLRSMTTKVKGKPAPVSNHIIRESLKLRAKDAEGVVLLHQNVQQLLDHVEVLQGRSVPPSEGSSEAAGPGPIAAHEELQRVRLGQTLRKLKQSWRLAVALAPLLTMKAAHPLGQELVQPASGSGGAAGQGGDSFDSDQLPETEQQRLRLAQELLTGVQAFGLEDCWQWKPLLDGHKLTKEGLAKGGPELGKLLAVVMDWQLAHPNGTEEECKAFLVARKEAA